MSAAQQVAVTGSGRPSTSLDPTQGLKGKSPSGEDPFQNSAGAAKTPEKGMAPVAQTFRSLRHTFAGVAVVSLLINILMLTGPLFMLQIYDRVLTSGSVQTLLVIAGLALTLYAFYGLLEGLRGRVLARVSQRMDAQLSGLAFSLSNMLPVKLGRQAAQLRPVQDLDSVRQFWAGPGPSAIFDLPWLPFYLGIVFLFHSLLGFVALAGALVICVLIGLNEVFSRKAASDANQSSLRRLVTIEEGRRNSEAIQSMGMAEALGTRWTADNDSYLGSQRRAADWSGFFGTSTKTFRFLLQSAVLGVGAWLAINQEISAGVMIAASIMTTRALAPVEQAIGQWRAFVASRQSLGRLKQLLPASSDESDMLALPLPRESLHLQEVACGPAGTATRTVEDISLKLSAGSGLGIVGPSGSGKSTLARAIVGAAPALAGSIRLDGAELAQWPGAKWGRFIGYLPQDIQLFDGTIGENISRFVPDAPADTVIEAAKLADVHQLITGLPEGYNTVIGSAGFTLSAGQRQRIALARALYGKPFLVVLDEPNSNLDTNGEAALARAIKAMRDRGSIVIVIAHHPSALSVVDQVLVLKDGKAAALGPREKVFRRLVKPVSQKFAASAGREGAHEE